MRDFTDDAGVSWRATLARRDDHDYKGRYHLVLARTDGGERVALGDVRWNDEGTAARTLATMSVVELRRRLRSARGRGAVHTG